MKVDVILNRKGREVKTIGPSATLATVAQRLRFDRIGALVVAEGDRLLGMISERDIVHHFRRRSRAGRRYRSRRGHDQRCHHLRS